MAKNQPAPKVFTHQPGKTIQQAVNNAAAHVRAVHASARRKPR
jgi:hypothetical protein